MHQSDRNIPQIEQRQRVMQVLAEADAGDLETAYANFKDAPDWHFARRPETGLVMVRGRIGGSGAPFNLGEMSVTRAAVALQSGETGHAYCAGRNQRKAAIAAFFDAASQNATLKPRIEAEVVAPLLEQRRAEDATAARQAAATKVDFFTLVRGED